MVNEADQSSRRPELATEGRLGPGETPRLGCAAYPNWTNALRCARLET
jgi:hypothetical protein